MRLWVDYDQCGGDYYVAAKLVHVVNGREGYALNTPYVTRFLGHERKIGSRSTAEKLALQCQREFESKEGITWNVARRLCDAAKVELHEEHPPEAGGA